MGTSAEQLRTLAARCREQARTAHPTRAEQLRRCARTFLHQALRRDLFDHGKQVGPTHVTPDTFRDYLRQQRTQSRTGPAPTSRPDTTPNHSNSPGGLCA